MNAYLSLTKLNGFDKKSSLFQFVGNKTTKDDLYKSVITEFQTAWKTEKQQDWYKEHFNRFYEISNRQQRCYIHSELACKSAFVTGQGRPSVLETHITLHPIYGIPYIAGTALKGMAAHFCHRYLGEDEPRFKQGGAYYQVLFGSQEQASSVCYFDALITPETVKDSLYLNVLTPHHQLYNKINLNQSSDVTDSAPHDDDTPVPVHFLEVRGSFRLELAYQGNDSHSDEWLEIAAEIVSAALQQEGVGGKTNSGYGRFISSLLKQEKQEL
ncbi:type III-B CRISPR module RAMP protein Cmr6 [Paenibacillus sp. GCM10012307]|uniref:Type III-B CRISPR module RAMP protein Cmr6 n=1 Tax=Paenibacillus roseus TaxID=2798579 RepID=A0A934JBC6_9BACL|nr:type III-B CRISPR module RAMP protein Cmr6 [Paenibacillus roseus]MBJ6363922.1 type III-B CRISPR module RAMP protein Cmr6 [Paenibacillus roseus]